MTISDPQLPKKEKYFSIAPELENVQKLMPVSKEDRENLKTDIAKNGIREPLKVYRAEAGKFFVLAGATRLEIARELSQELNKEILIPYQIIDDLSDEEKEQFCIDDNVNRRHLTADQKRRLIERELILNPEQSDRQIAEKVNADHKTVAVKRRDLVAGGEIPHLDKRQGKDGKIQTTEKKKPVVESKKTVVPEQSKKQPEKVAMYLSITNALSHLSETIDNNTPAEINKAKLVSLKLLVGENDNGILSRFNFTDKQLGILQDHINTLLKRVRK